MQFCSRSFGAHEDGLNAAVEQNGRLRNLLTRPLDCAFL
ncbi:hypothetical protein FHY02_004180 [Sphingomonas sp. BK069]|nr:hypothetical protein [Sphingomonas sp. BK069]